MEEPIQVKAEPIEFRSYSLQSSEPIEPQIKNEPIEFQSASENNDMSTKQNDYITECNSDSQQPYPVMLHFAGSYELLPSNSSQVTNEKEISDTHLSKAIDGLIKSELSDCDTEIVKAEEAFPSDKDIFNTSDYYGKDNHACHIMRSSEDEIIQIESELPVTEIVSAPDKLASNNDMISGKDINANAKPNGLHDNHVVIKLVDRKTPSSLLGGNSVASAVIKSQKTSENAPLFAISVTKKSSPHPMIYVKLPFQNSAPLFFMATKSNTNNEITIGGEKEICYDGIDISTMSNKSHPEISGSGRLNNVHGTKDNRLIDENYGLKAVRNDHSYNIDEFDELKGIKNDHSYMKTEESLDLEDELDSSVNDLQFYLKKYKIHSCICDIQELIDNRKDEGDLFMELILNGKLHGKTDNSSVSKQAVMTQNSSSFEPPNDKGPMHFIHDSHRGERRMLTCGICNKNFNTVPMFTNHLSFSSCEDKVKNIPFFLNFRFRHDFWVVEYDHKKQTQRKTGYMCRHCIRTFDSYSACIKHGQQCDFTGKHIPNVEFTLLKTCESCRGKQIRISDSTDALRELAQQFEVVYTLLNKNFKVCDKSNIKCQCNQLHKRNPRIKTITFEIDATTVHIKTHASNNLYPAHTKKEVVELNKEATEGIKEQMMELNEGTNYTEIDYKTDTCILRKVETVLLRFPVASVQKFERKIQIGTTCSEEICCCENRFAYHSMFKSKQEGLTEATQCGFCLEMLYIDPSAFFKHVSKCSVTNEDIILPITCRDTRSTYFCGLCSSTFTKLCEAVSHMGLCAKTFPYICKDRTFGSMKLKLLPYCKNHHKYSRCSGLSSKDCGFERYLDILIKLDPEAYCECNR